MQVTVCQPPSPIPIPVWPFAAELQQLWERSQVDTSASGQLLPAIEADDVAALQVKGGWGGRFERGWDYGKIGEGEGGLWPERKFC